MRTIAMIAQKGGVGKTTIAFSLAVEFQKGRGKAAVLDLDPQASASMLSDLRGEEKEPRVYSLHSQRLSTTMTRLRKAKIGTVLIDTPPHTADIALAAAREAELLISPCKPAVLDVAAMKRTLELAALAQRPLVVVLNLARVNHALTGEATETLTAMGATVSPVVLHERMDHINAHAHGQSATEYRPKGKATEELTQLGEWVTNHYAQIQRGAKK